MNAKAVEFVSRFLLSRVCGAALLEVQAQQLELAGGTELEREDNLLRAATLREKAEWLKEAEKILTIPLRDDATAGQAPGTETKAIVPTRCAIIYRAADGLRGGTGAERLTDYMDKITGQADPEGGA